MHLGPGPDEPRLVFHQKRPVGEEFYRHGDLNLTCHVAPHTLCIMGCGFMAIDRYCFVMSKLIKEQRPADEDEHEIELPEHYDSLRTMRILRKFLRKLNLPKVYRFIVVNPFDLNETIAIIPILIAIYEQFKAPEEDYQEVLLEFLREQNVEIYGAAQIIKATRDGSLEFCQVLDGEDTRQVPLTSFNHYFDFLFIRTDLHEKDFYVYNTNGSNIVNSLQRGFENAEDVREIDMSLGVNLTAYSEVRLDSRNYQEADIERGCERAMKEFMSLTEREDGARGYEVQRGGIVVVTKKGKMRGERMPRLLMDETGTVKRTQRMDLTQLIEFFYKLANFLYF